MKWVHVLGSIIVYVLSVIYKAIITNYTKTMGLIKNTKQSQIEPVSPESYKNMKLYLQYTSEIEKEFIREAAGLIDEEDAKKRGWECIGYGCFKRAYRKGTIVVKFNINGNNNMHMLRELILYKEADRKYKKHLARTFGGDGRKIIQKFVDYKKDYLFTEKDNKKMCKIATALGMGDYCAGHNVVKTKDGKIVFYDFSGHCLRNI